ncbi:hypothetical protein LCGC14_0542550 [marine sediment metagenome]|uniref:Uncharacterized protein n=1 Tax=marine sediment metagenome TaxID=412755 RepID=A0A0F9RSI9_9ZZZZ
MSLQEAALPIMGVSEALPLDKENPTNSPHINNVRPFDTLERRVRLGQRPGQDKKYALQLGTGSPVVASIALTYNVPE